MGQPAKQGGRGPLLRLGTIFTDWLPGGRKIRGKPIRPRWGFSLGYLESCGAVRGDMGRKG